MVWVFVGGEVGVGEDWVGEREGQGVRVGDFMGLDHIGMPNISRDVGLGPGEVGI